MADARKALELLPDETIDCIITSPPYGTIKDYGPKNQIGYGQHTSNEYLPDLSRVLAELYRSAKQGAALWVIADNLRSNGAAFPLPWEIVDRARTIGWSLQDLVVWDKGRSLPWTHRGQFRDVCEYIALLAKGSLKTFNVDAVRETDHLSSYWVRYPERYHPNGKAPSDLWHFPIPVQGSWSNGNMRHFCPFPVGLIARMINISTGKDAIVLDPFAGTGSVIGVASYLGRYGVGIEVNKEFVQEFNKKGFNEIQRRSREDLPKKIEPSNSLTKVIINLRMLKYPKVLFSQLERGDRLNGNAAKSIAAFVVAKVRPSAKSKQSHTQPKVGSICIYVLIWDRIETKHLSEQIKKVTEIPPLSKFGIIAEIRLVPYKTWGKSSYFAKLVRGRLYAYTSGVFFKYQEPIDHRDLPKKLMSGQIKRKMPIILSNIRMDIIVPTY